MSNSLGSAENKQFSFFEQVMGLQPGLLSWAQILTDAKHVLFLSMPLNDAIN